MKGVTILPVQDQKLRIDARTTLHSLNFSVHISLKFASNFSHSSCGLLHTLSTTCKDFNGTGFASGQKLFKSQLVM